MFTVGDRLNAVYQALQGSGGSTAPIVLVHVINAGNGTAVYSVPANKTFVGSVYLRATLTPSQGASYAYGISAATGGQLAQRSYTWVTYNGPGTAFLDINDPTDVGVNVAGGAGGNAITITLSGNASAVEVILVGVAR